MKKISPLFTIPLTALLIILAVVFGYKMFAPKPVEIAREEFPNALGTDAPKKPKTYLGSLFGTNVTPSPTPATAVQLSNELKNTYDDGGQSDLDAIAKDASSL